MGEKKTSNEQLADILAVLTASQPNLHGPSDALTNWGLAPEVLRWIFDNVRAEHTTLETGCGQSTLVFALKGARHTAISPVGTEHERVRAWAGSQGIDLSKVDFRNERSETLLPVMEPTPLDVVLIDGWHAFPAPFIDWFYTCERIRPGGCVIIDDLQIVTGKILHDFMLAEVGRWKLRQRFERSAVFEKLVPKVMEGADLSWRNQPYCVKKLYFSRKQKFMQWLKPKAWAIANKVPGGKALTRPIWRAVGGK